MPLLTRRRARRGHRARRRRVIEDATGVDPRPWFRCPFGAGLGRPARPRRGRRRRATGTSAGTWPPRTGSPTATARRSRATCVAGVEAHGDGDGRPAPQLADRRRWRRCPGIDRRPARRRRDLRARRRARRGPGGARAGREPPADRRASPSSPSTAATRRPTSRLVGRRRATPGGACAGRRPRTSRSAWRPGPTRLAELVDEARRAGRARAGRDRRAAASRVLRPRRRRHARPTSAGCGAPIGRAASPTATLVVNDAFAPVRAGSDRGWGVGVICGAGRQRGRDRARRADAPGSPRSATSRATGAAAADVGLAALGAAVRARDGRGPRTRLERLVPAHFGLRAAARRHRCDRARTGSTRRGCASSSPVVFGAAARGRRGRARRSSTGWPTSSRRWRPRSSAGST